MNLEQLFNDWLVKLSNGNAWLELALLLLSLAAGALIARVYYKLQRQHEGEAASNRALALGRSSLSRLAFPLASLALVLLSRLILQLSHIKPSLLPLAAQLLLAMAVIRMAVFALRHTFAQAAWLAASEKFVSFLVWSSVALDLLGVLPELIDLLESISLHVGSQKLSVWTLLQGGVTVLATVLAALWLGGLAEERLMRADSLDSSLRVVFSRLTKALLMLLAVLVALSLVGIDLTALSVFGGALGVGLGFGLQKIASSYVSGFIILLDRSIRMGNVIAVGTDRGQVTQITTRYTVLRNVSGVETIIPNEMLVSSVVLNESLTDPKVRVALPVQVAYGSNLEQAMAILVSAAKTQERVLAEPEPQAFVVAFADSGINLELGFWLADTHKGTIGVRSAINLAIYHGLQQAGIEIPYPQREVRILGAQALIKA